MKDNNPYKILSVDKDAPQEVIKAAYRALMKGGEAHPDLGGDLTNAQAINEAFETLSDEKKRQDINKQLEIEQQQQTHIKAFRMVRRQDRFLAVCMYCQAINEFEFLHDIYQSKCGSCKNWFVKHLKSKKPQPEPRRQAQTRARERFHRNSQNASTASSQSTAQQPRSAANIKNAKTGFNEEQFAMYLYQRRLYVRALADFRQLLRKFSENAFYEQMIGMCLYQLHDFLNASKHLQKSIVLKPDNFEARLHLGIAFVRLGRHEGAIPHFQSALKLRSNDLDIKAWLGDCYYHAGQYKQAIHILEPVLEQKPELQQALYVCALCWYKLGEFGRARDRFLDSKQHFPENRRRIMEMVLQCDRHLRMRG